MDLQQMLLFVFFRQVSGAIILSVGLATSPNLSKSDIGVCGTANNIQPLDFSIYAVVVTLLTSVFGLFFVMFFDTDYKRLQAEHEIDDSFAQQHPNTEDASDLPAII